MPKKQASISFFTKPALKANRYEEYLKNMKLLLTDDDEVTRFSLSSVLRRHLPCEVIEAEDGLIAWQFLQQKIPPDLCLLDIMMPALNGLELLGRIRAAKHLADLKVVICSCKTDQETVLRLARLKVSGYIVKPYTPKEVLGTIQKVLGTKWVYEYLQFPSEVRRRLGIDEQMYTRSLNELTIDSAHLLDVIAKAFDVDDRRAAAEHLAILRSVAQKLGAIKVTRLLQKTESVVFTGSSFEIQDLLEQLRIEQRNLGRSSSLSDPKRDCLKFLNPRGDNWVASSALHIRQSSRVGYFYGST